MSSSDGLCEAPPRLLWLASLSRSERTRIAGDAQLTAKVRAAEPNAWRGILDAQDTAARSRLPVLRSDDAEPMRRQALNDLDAERQQLALLADGRRGAIFDAGARLARYAANSILTGQEIEAALIDAWQVSGAAAKHGLDYPRGAIRRSLEKGRNDPLPPLARRFRSGGPDGR